MAYHNLRTELFDSTKHELTKIYFSCDYNKCSVKDVIDVILSIAYESKCYNNIFKKIEKILLEFLEEVCEGEYKMEELVDIIDERIKYWIDVCGNDGNKSERFRLSIIGKTKIWLSEEEAKNMYDKI